LGARCRRFKSSHPDQNCEGNQSRATRDRSQEPADIVLAVVAFAQPSETDMRAFGSEAHFSKQRACTLATDAAADNTFRA
jgi:hypothetical protein